MYYNKTTGDKWAEMKKHPSTKGWILVSNYFSLNDDSQAMGLYFSQAASANGFPKGYYHVRKLLNGSFENESYDEISAVSSTLKEVEPNAFLNTKVSVVRFHNVGNSKWQDSEDNIVFNTITGPVPYHINADYVYIADAQYDAWKQDELWGNDDLIRCTNYEYLAHTYEPIELDYSQQSTVRAANEPSTLYTNKVGNQYWEYSNDGGNTWVKVDSHKSYFVDSNPQKGQSFYRALTKEGNYIDFKINYYDRIPSTVNILANKENFVSEDTVILKLDMDVDSCTYQWYKDGKAIIDYVDATSSTFTISGVSVTNSGAYCCVITNPVGRVLSATYNLKVNRCEQKLPQIELGEITYSSDARIELPYATDKGLPISYFSGNDEIATIVDKRFVIVKKAGTVSIVASQSGSVNYLPIESTPYKLVIHKAQQEITPFSLDEVEYSAWGCFTLEDSLSSVGMPLTYTSSNPNVAEIEYAYDNGTKKHYWEYHVCGVGETTITATQDGNDCYLPAVPVSSKLVVRKRSQSYEPNFSGTLAYKQKAIINRQSSLYRQMKLTSNDKSVAIIVGDTVYAVHPGATTIHYYEAGDQHTEAVEGELDVTVSKATAGIDDGDVYEQYSEEPYSLNIAHLLEQDYTVTSSNEDVIIPLYHDYVKIKRSGTAVVTVELMENEYYKHKSVKIDFTIQQAPQSISMSCPSFIVFSGEEIRYNITDLASAKTPIKCYSLDPNIISVEDDEIVVHKIGRVKLAFVASADSRYSAAEDVVVEVNVISSDGLDTTKTIDIDTENHQVVLTSISYCGISSVTEMSLNQDEETDKSIVTDIAMPDGTKIAFGQDDGQNAPRYYANTGGIRVYANNTISFFPKEELGDIARITLYCDGAYLGNGTATFKDLADGSLEYKNYLEGGNGGTQLRVKKIKIEYTKDLISAIDEHVVSDENTDIERIYSIDGLKRERVEHGINIVVYKNGSRKKIYCK